MRKTQPKVRTPKHEEYYEEVLEFAVYIKEDLRVVGIYSTNEDAQVANNNFALRKLTRLYGYHIQMVIKE